MYSQKTRNLVISLVITISIILFILIRELKINISNIQVFISNFDILAPFVFIIIYIIFTLIGVSAVIFTILAGTIFGLWLGWTLVVIAGFISASTAFFITRYFKKFFPKRNPKKNTLINNMINQIEKNAKKNGFIAIITLRISFLPYIPLSYAAGLVKNLKWTHFALATFITNIVGTFFFILLGFSLTKSIPLFITAIILLILFSQIPRIINKNQNKN